MLTKGSRGSSLGRGESSTPEYLPVPYLIVLLVSALAKESVFVEAVTGLGRSLAAGGGGGGSGGGMKSSLMSSGRDSSRMASPCMGGNRSLAGLPTRDGDNALRGDDNILESGLRLPLGLPLGDSSTDGKGGSVFRMLTLSLGGDGKLFSISDMSIVDPVDSGRDMTADTTTALSNPSFLKTT